MDSGGDPLLRANSRHRAVLLGVVLVVMVCSSSYLLFWRSPKHAAAPTPNLPTGNSSSSADLTDPRKKELAMELVSSAENSSLNWRAQYGYIEDIGDGRGYTGGIIGFTTANGDMLSVVRSYDQLRPGNALSRYIPALEAVIGTNSHAGLGAGFMEAWKLSASDPRFQAAQDHERDAAYFDPAVAQAKADGLHALGQFIYYDAIVMHGSGDGPLSFDGIRTAALLKARAPAQGGNESNYLNEFLDARVTAMRAEFVHANTDRVEMEQRVFLRSGNLELNPPLAWSVYGDKYLIP